MTVFTYQTPKYLILDDGFHIKALDPQGYPSPKASGPLVLDDPGIHARPWDHRSTRGPRDAKDQWPRVAERCERQGHERPRTQGR